MKNYAVLLGTIVLALGLAASHGAEKISLFNGKDFSGWEGDTNKIWRIRDGAFVGGGMATMVERNEFLATRQSFTNFVLRLKLKLVGTEGFVNGGVQIRTKRIPNHHEVSGYQADMGEGWWGSLYDESRRNKVLAKADPDLIAKILKPGDWNDYEIRCQGKHIEIRLNGQKTVDYTEEDNSIPDSGIIAFQIHGGGKAEAWYKDITLEPL
jgi:hypothetical protein